MTVVLFLQLVHLYKSFPASVFPFFTKEIPFSVVIPPEKVPLLDLDAVVSFSSLSYAFVSLFLVTSSLIASPWVAEDPKIELSPPTWDALSLGLISLKPVCLANSSSVLDESPTAFYCHPSCWRVPNSAEPEAV
jgi:hypothetical protein